MQKIVKKILKHTAPFHLFLFPHSEYPFHENKYELNDAIRVQTP